MIIEIFSSVIKIISMSQKDIAQYLSTKYNFSEALLISGT